jgi:hypothetical protein
VQLEEGDSDDHGWSGWRELLIPFRAS